MKHLELQSKLYNFLDNKKINYGWINVLVTSVFYAFWTFILATNNFISFHSSEYKKDLPFYAFHYHINSTDYHFFTAMYVLGFVIFAIPAWILITKYGPSKIAKSSTFLLLISSLIFFFNTTEVGAFFAALLFGASGSILLCMYQFIRQWFKKKNIFLPTGIALSISILGAILYFFLAEVFKNITKNVEDFILIINLVVTIAIAILSWLLLRDKFEKEFYDDVKLLNLFKYNFKNIPKVLWTNKRLSLFCYITFSMYVAILIYAYALWTQWSTNYFLNVQVNNLQIILGIMLIGCFFGNIFFPLLIKRFHNKHKKIIMLIVSILLFIFFAILFYRNINFVGLTIIMLFIGFLSGARSLVIGFILAYNKSKILYPTFFNTYAMMFRFLLTFIIQILIGEFANLTGGYSSYSTVIITLIIIMISIIFIFIATKTKSKEQVGDYKNIGK